MQIKEEVRKIFSDVLILPQEEIGDRAHFVIDLGGDSLSVIGVIAQLEEKYNILVSMRDEVDDHLINSMAVVLDVVIPEGPVADRYEQLKACIRTKQRYETQRMR